MPHFVCHSSVDGHLGFVCLLAFVSNAGVNIAITFMFKFLFAILLDIYLEVELLDHIVILCLIF